MAKPRKGRRQREMLKAAWALLKQGQRETIASNLQAQYFAPKPRPVAPAMLSGSTDSLIIGQSKAARFAGVNWSWDERGITRRQASRMRRRRK